MWLARITPSASQPSSTPGNDGEPGMRTGSRSVHAQLGADRARESGDDEVVGVGDQPAYDVVLDRSLEVHGVPVLLVLVVAGPDPEVGIAQLECPGRVALEVHRVALPGQ